MYSVMSEINLKKKDEETLRVFNTGIICSKLAYYHANAKLSITKKPTRQQVYNDPNGGITLLHC